MPYLWISLFVLAGLGTSAPATTMDWPQFGGPNRNFRVESPDLLDRWPDAGPAQLWTRPLGEGYASPVVVGDVLYTMYGEPGEEIVVAMSAATGDTLWERRYPVQVIETMNLEQGSGPHATPLVQGDLLFSVGVTGRLLALDRATGSVAWERDLIAGEGGTPVSRGYSSSPLAYGDTIVLPVGGPDRAVMAFRQSDGAVVWSRHDFDNTNASPILVQLDGRAQVVVFMVDVIAGLDPVSGDLLWSLPAPQRFGDNISTPVFGADGLLFCTSSNDGGSRVLALHASLEEVTAQELWQHREMRIYYTNAVRIDDHVYGSSGDLGPTFFSAVDVRTGEVAWRSRELLRSNFIHADGKLVLRDEEGRLTLASVTPEGLEILSQAELFEPGPPVAPSLSEGRLYVRDRTRIAAFDLRANPSARSAS